MLGILQKGSVRTAVFVAQQVLGMLGYVVSVILVASADWLGPKAYWAILLLPVFAFATTAIHEIGHFVGARIGRMTVICAQISFLEFWMLRDGMYVRFRRPNLHADRGGYLLSCMDFSRPLRRQNVILLLAGPLANLFAAAMLALTVRSGLAGHLAAFCSAFAVLNFAAGIINLLPDSSAVPMVSTH